MASIIKIGKKWRAQVRRAGSKPLTQTFEKWAEAEQWGRQVEHELDQQTRSLQQNKAFLAGDMTLLFLIEEYRRMRQELARPVDPTSNTHYMLAHLAEDLGHERAADLTPRRMVEWARLRKEQGAGGYTINMELSLLGTVIRHCASFLQVQLPDVVGQARPLLHYGQLITGGGRRTRRPTQEELASLLDWLDLRAPAVAEAVRVAAVTGLRRGELARIAWADVDPKRKAVLVRHRKHPRRIEATDEWVPLLGESWDVVQRQPSKGVDARVFPVSPETLTDNVTAGTRALGIPDLRLHDMRREATSALRDMGFDADARKTVTGHKSDEIHSRYVKVDMDDLHRKYDAARQETQPRQPRPRRGSARPT